MFTNAGPAPHSELRDRSGIFALEQSIDELADRLSLDPLALREVIDTGGTRRLEGASSGAARRGGEVRVGRTVSGIRSRTREARRRRRAVSVAVHHRSADRLRGPSHKRRSVEAFSAAQDVGTGTGRSWHR